MESSPLDLESKFKALQQALQKQLRFERFRMNRLEQEMGNLKKQLEEEKIKRKTLETQFTAEIDRLTRAVDGDDAACEREEIMTAQRYQDQSHDEIISGDSGAHSSTPQLDSIDVSAIGPKHPIGGKYIPTEVRPAATKHKRPMRQFNVEKRRRTEGDAVPADIAAEEQILQAASLPPMTTRKSGRSGKESAGKILLRVSESNSRDSSSQASTTEEIDGLNASTKLMNTYMQVQDAKENEPMVEIISKLGDAVQQTIEHWQPKKPSILEKKMELVMEMCSTTTIHHFKMSNVYSIGPQSPWPRIIQEVFNDYSEDKQKELMKHVTLSARQSTKSYFGTLVHLLVQKHEAHCPTCKLVPGGPL